MNVVVHSGISRSAGGLYYAVSALCRDLDKKGVRISVLGRDDPFVEADRQAWAPASVSPYKGLAPTGFSLVLRRLLVEKDPDLIHQHGLWMDDQWAASQWQKRTKRPVVISPHGMLDPWAVQNSAWKKKLVGTLFANESLQRATCLHALCQSEVESIRAFGLKNPIAIIPNGVELPNLGEQKSTERRRKKLLFLGRIHPKKGLSELIHAWSKAHHVSSDWKLVIAGWDDGGYEAGLIALSKELGVDESIEFVGPKFGVAKDVLLGSVDAFILPSFSEGLPMSVLEAWSYGVPVVMTDFCNLPEGFAAGAAIRVEPTPEAVSHGLERLVSLSVTDLQNMGAKGRQLVEEKFTWPKIATEMKQVYTWCLDGGEPPPGISLV